MKEFLVERHFKSNEEVKDAVKQWSTGLAAEVYDKGIQKNSSHSMTSACMLVVTRQKNNLRVCNNDTLIFYCLFFLIAQQSLLSG